MPGRVAQSIVNPKSASRFIMCVSKSVYLPSLSYQIVIFIERDEKIEWEVIVSFLMMAANIIFIKYVGITYSTFHHAISSVYTYLE